MAEKPCLQAQNTKMEGLLLPFPNPMVLEHSIADKFAAAPQAGKDYSFSKISLIDRNTKFMF